MARARNDPVENGIGNDGTEPHTPTVGDEGRVGDVEIAGIPTIDPSAIGGRGDAIAADNEPGKRGRGRPRSTAPKSRRPTGKKENAAPVSVKGIEKILYSIHLMASRALIPELELDADESKLLADAVTEVASHYSVVVDPKVVAWAGLLGVCGSIYGPRVAAWKMRTTMENKAPRASVKSNSAVPNNFDYEADAFIAPLSH